jgi:hypothetical protein
MLKHSRRSVLAALTACLLFNSPALTLARATRPAPQQKDEKKDEKKDKKKEDAAAKDDKPKPTKQEREYQKIKDFSQKRYDTNAEFKAEVEEAFRQKQREHSEYAFDMNTRDESDEKILRSGDRLKVQDTLYDNPLAQGYVNRVGQSVVPANSTRLYAFKVTLNPIPEARSLSTGTVYVSSGLLAQIDNEAQLAYVLGHEIAHVERNHWFEDVLVEHGLDDYNEKQQQKRNIIGGIANMGARMMTGGFVGASNLTGTMLSVYAQYAVPSLVKLSVPNAVVTWDKGQEDEADEWGIKYMLARNYDPREVPKFYEALKRASYKDRRAGLGFMANAARVIERADYITGVINPMGFGGSMQTQLLYGAVNLNAQRQMDAAVAAAQPAADKAPDTGKSLDPSRRADERAEAARKLNEQMSDDIKIKIDAGQLIGSTAEFLAVMAELKRDNGVRAYYYDMFQMARDNLSESLQIRSNDPYAHFYYGKVLKLTARTASEKAQALGEFQQAINYDARRVLPEARLYRALALMERKDPAQVHDIVASLKDYVGMYQREHGGALPPNMDVIYDYMQEAGEASWAAAPALNVSTKNIDPLGVSTVAAAARPPSAAAPAAQPTAAAATPTPPGKPMTRGNRKP